MNGTTPKIAIVGPDFFSYMHEVRDEFRRQSIPCEYFDERHSNSISSKIAYRLGLTWFLNKKRKEHLSNLREKVIGGNFTDVMLISVEVVDRDFVLSLKKNSVNVHVYMWDSAKNKGDFLTYLDLISGKGTFDLNDSNKYGMKYIPLFSESCFSLKDRKLLLRDIDVSFCGTLHSDRAYHLYQLSRVAERRNLNLHLMNFIHSKFMLAVKSLRRISNAYFIKTVSTSGYSKEEVSEVMFRSKFVFDMQHSGQGGLTARTFVSLRSGACLVTFNPNVYSLPKSFHERIFLIQEVEDINHLNLSDYEGLGGLTDSQDYYLSLGRFADNLLEMMGCSFKGK